MLAGFFYSCNEDHLPKPSAFLRLDYPSASYSSVNTKLPFKFNKNNMALLEDSKHRPSNLEGVNISYPKLKATIYMTYKSVEEKNLDSLLMDAQSLTQKHTIKADAISYNVYENQEAKVFGMLYDVEGNAASQSQFYATDSINHFIRGALYFYAKPNFDSIYPAVAYLKKDIIQIMESIQWKN